MAWRVVALHLGKCIFLICCKGLWTLVRFLESGRIFSSLYLVVNILEICYSGSWCIEINFHLRIRVLRSLLFANERINYFFHALLLLGM